LLALNAYAASHARRGDAASICGRYHVAEVMSTDVDQPRNLAKSVKVE